MKQKPGRASREPRESSLASGWTVAGEQGEPGELESSAAPAEERIGAAPHLANGTEAQREAAPALDAGTASATGAEAASSTDASETYPDERPQISNGALVVLGVFGGLYLLYTWGWFIVARAYSENNSLTAAGSGVIGGVLQQIVFWAAPLAPPLWFFTALAFGRGGRTKLLAILLVVGAVVLVPLPMLIERGA